LGGPFWHAGGPFWRVMDGQLRKGSVSTPC
jgi:hypothetical protein